MANPYDDDSMDSSEALEIAGTGAYNWLKKQLDLSALRRRLPRDEPAWLNRESAARPPYTPPGGDQYSPENISNMIDVRRLGLDFQKAAQGDPDAKARVQALGPSFTEGMSKPKPKPSTMDLPAGRDLGSDLLTAEMPSRDLPDATYNTQDKTGGAGVEVKHAGPGPGDDEPRKFDWGSAIDNLTVGLTDLGNIVGNPRAPVGGGMYEMAKQSLAEKQMDQLKRRQQMWTDAYKESQSLPGEIMGDERFSDLAQAKAALDKDMLDGKIDNPNTVKNFLFEQKKAEPELLRMQRMTNQRDEIEMADILAKHKQENESLYGPSAASIAAQAAADRAEKIRQFNVGEETQRRGQDITSAYHRFAAAQAAGARGDARDAASQARLGSFLGREYEAGIKRRLPQGFDELDPKRQEQLLNHAAEASLAEQTPRLIQAAKQHGIIFEDTTQGAGGWGSLGSPQGQYRVHDQYFNSLPEAMQYLQQLLVGG